MDRQSGRGYRPLLLALGLAAGAFPRCAPAAGPEAGEEFWAGRFEEARRKASEDGRPVLLLFLSSRPGPLERVVDDVLGQRLVRERVHPARARADDVGDLLGALQVERVPAVLLLDRLGGVLERWEGTLPLDLWAQAERAARKLKQAEEEATRAIARARAALAKGDDPAALAACEEARTRCRSGHPRWQEAAGIEKQVLARADAALRKELAREGLIPDRKLSAALARLRERFPHRAFADRIDRELDRIRLRPIAGRKEG